MPKRYLNDQEFRDLLRHYINQHFSRMQDAAEHWGLPPNYLSMILHGHKPPKPEILAELGYDRIRIYRRIV